jgi:hypothetical protein
VNAGLKSLINIFPMAEDRDVIILEAKNDPNFEAQLEEALNTPDGPERIALSAKKAVLHDLNPDLYPEMEGTWPVLRSIISKIIGKVSGSVESNISNIKNSKSTGLGDLGQDIGAIMSIVAPLVNAIGSVGSSLYIAHLQAQTNQTIANDQLQANMAQIHAKEAMAQAQIAIANAQTEQAVQSVLPQGLAVPVAGVVNTLTADVGGGVKLWEALLLGFFIVKEMK